MPTGRRSAASLSSNELDILAAAYLPSKGVYWVRASDQFMISEGWRTRAGRAMRGAGFIRQQSSTVAWLPAVAGAGRHKTDEPARLMEITPAGVAALRQRMGADSFRQLAVLAKEQREIYARRSVAG